MNINDLEQKLIASVDALHAADLAAVRAGHDAAQMQLGVQSIEEEIDRTRKQVIAAAYAVGVIDGKNADIRSSQEEAILIANDDLQRLGERWITARGNLTSANNAHDLLQVEFRHQRTYHAALKAILAARAANQLQAE